MRPVPTVRFAVPLPLSITMPTESSDRVATTTSHRAAQAAGGRTFWRIQLLIVIFALPLGAAYAQSPNCNNLLPSGADDSRVIQDCLNLQGIARLAPNTNTPVVFRLDSALKITTPGAQLIGKRNATNTANLTSLKPYVPTCPTPDFGVPPWLDSTGGPWVQIVNVNKRKWRHAILADFSGTGASAGVGIQNLDIDVTEMGSQCQYVTSMGATGSIQGSFLIKIVEAPSSVIEYVGLRGSPIPIGTPTGRGPGGALNAGIAVSSSPDLSIRFCKFENLAYYGDDSGAEGAIQVASSRNSLIEGCVSTGSAWGIVVENEVGTAGDSSYSRVINNSVEGVAHLSSCTPCAGGRGIKLEACANGGGAALPLRYVLVEGNSISHFGGRPNHPEILGSGLHLTCNVHNSTLRSNTVSVESNAGGALLVSGDFFGATYPTVLNTFQNNSFTGGNLGDVYFYATGSDQIGIGRGSLSGSNGNTFGMVKTDPMTPPVCDDYSRGQFKIPLTDQVNFGTIVQGQTLNLQGWSTSFAPNNQVIFKFKNALGATVLSQTHLAGGCGRVGSSYQLSLVPGKYYVSSTWRDYEIGATATDVGIGILRVLSTTGGDSIGGFIPSSSAWFLKNTNSAGNADVIFTYGASQTFVPLVDDWNGDGVDSPGLYDPATSTFFLKNSNSAGPADIVLSFGAGGSNFIPISGDWNGDGASSVGLYDSSSGSFFLKDWNVPGNADRVFSYGPTGGVGVPVVGDWNGDLVETIGVYLPSSAVFFLRNSNSAGPADLTFSYGPAGATPIVGDWNHDGFVTIGVYLQGAYFLRNQNSSGAADVVFNYGPSSWKPLSGNWDGQ